MKYRTNASAPAAECSPAAPGSDGSATAVLAPVADELGLTDDEGDGATLGSGSLPEQAVSPRVRARAAAAMTARVPVTSPIIPRAARERNRRRGACGEGQPRAARRAQRIIGSCSGRRAKAATLKPVLPDDAASAAIFRFPG